MHAPWSPLLIRLKRFLLTPRALPILGASFFAVLLLWNATTPTFGRLTYHFDGQSIDAAELPLSANTTVHTGTQLKVTVPIAVGWLFPTWYGMEVTSHLISVNVNGTAVDTPPAPSFATTQETSVHLGRFLHPGDNVVTLNIFVNDQTGTLSIGPSHWDPLVLMEFAAALLLLALFLQSLALRFRAFHGELPWIFLGGVVLRWWYVLSTLPYVRGHDTDAHVEYIRFVLNHFHIPASSQGWEYYQPPLYYFLSALWTSVDLSLGHTPAAAVHHLQWLSLILSLIGLGMALWIATLLFPQSQQRLARVLFASLIATCPGLIFLASQINNDALLLPLSFLAFGLLLRWWQHGRTSDWYVAILVIGLALLTKTNAAPLILVAWILLFLRRGSRKKTLALFLGSAGILLVFTGWLYALRALGDHSLTVVGNSAELDDDLRLMNAPQYFFRLNPVLMLVQPFNNTFLDSTGRQYLWAFLVRSVLFDEFSFPYFPIYCSIMVGLLLTTLPLALLGYVADLLWKPVARAPLLVCLPLYLLAIACFRFLYPFGPSQDFRYITLAAIPFFAFAVEGTALFPPRIRAFLQYLLSVLCLACIVFFGQIFFLT